MKTYEQERDNEAKKYCEKDFPSWAHSTSEFANMFAACCHFADWCKSRFEKIVAELETDKKILIEQHDMWKDSFKKCNDQLTSRDAMIEKLKTMLQCHCGCIPCRGQCVSESALKIMREECLSELAEWEKTK